MIEKSFVYKKTGLQKELLKNYLLGLCTPQEEKQINEWLQKDPLHVQILQDKAKRLKEGSSYLSVYDKQRIKEEVLDEIEENASKSYTVGNRRFKKRQFPRNFYQTAQFWWKTAAAIIIIIITAAIGAYYYNNANHVNADKSSTEWLTQTVPNGQKLTFYFSDGTFIKVNSGSTLCYPKNFEGKYREVYLKGEAFFSVAENKSKPFLVHAGEITTRDLGTAFNINAYPGQHSVQVAVVEGKVEVLLNSTGSRKKPKSFKKIVLTKNQWASYRANSNQLKKRKGNIHNMVAWKDHVLVFDNKNLAQVARMLERWYGVKVKIKGNDLKKVVFKGRYDAKSLEKVLDSIQFIFGIHYTLQDSVVTISASG